MSKVMLRSEYTLRELAYEISHLPHDEVKEFVKELDELMKDYDFTKAIAGLLHKRDEECLECDKYTGQMYDDEGTIKSATALNCELLER